MSDRFDVPTESDIMSVDVAPPSEGSGALTRVTRGSASTTGTKYSARQKQKQRGCKTRQWMADGLHDAMTMRSRVEMAFVVARPWRLGLGCSGAGALAMWQCHESFHVSIDVPRLHRTFVPLLVSCTAFRDPSTPEKNPHAVSGVRTFALPKQGSARPIGEFLPHAIF
jgi:hypothetical protein